jgi:hypothetical protein
MIFEKPVVLVSGTGGCVEELASGKLMKESEHRLYIAHSAEEAVEKAFALCQKE